ncbi:THO complex subunit 4A-like [Dioscorea cayenensis subsp. rotundata]|uniref:THO complex subunit 4A-like n=1 Tax=Dioscorea cayennensis subsp. rotundata TaxID=55577 RepID=A0AB40C8H9_DIOCR|nr:THO complex subunit 4A-like [Dioscorea cayenensis subsp. rotundata]
MSDAFDMSLDDLIKQSKKLASGGNSMGRARYSRSGPARWVSNRSGNRPAPYSMEKAPESKWQHDLYTMNSMPMSSSIGRGTMLYISNLDYDVSNEDIKQLFSEVGDIKRYSIHYDKSGRSKGTAEVVFTRREDALAVMQSYNNVRLDGKPMRIEAVGMNILRPSAEMPINVGFVKPIGGRKSGHGRGGSGRWPRGGQGQRRARRQLGGHGGSTTLSVEALDADLDKYHLEEMETN